MRWYQCLCCEFAAAFESPEAAFQANWDTPPRFPFVLCNLCPAFPLAHLDGDVEKVRAWHRAYHERWRAEGRPTEFTQETCVPKQYWLTETDADLNEMLKAVRAVLSPDDASAIRDHCATDEILRRAMAAIRQFRKEKYEDRHQRN